MEKINITELMKKMDYRICAGGKYTLQCYGKNARSLMFGNEYNMVFAECVFDTVTDQVYEMSYLRGKDETGVYFIRYTWRHPDYKVAYRKEAALLRETKNYKELPYKLMSLDSVLECMTKYDKEE